ncbi:MAG: hypothetical protein ABFS14_10310 [Gemmatimonadota bacterium]
MRIIGLFAVVLLAASVASCSEPTVPTAPPESNSSLEPAAPLFSAGQAGTDDLTAVDDVPIYADFSNINKKLARMRLGAELAVAEFVTVSTKGEYGRIVFASDRGNKQTPFDWVPNDPRRGGLATISYIVDESDGDATGGLTNADTEPAIDRAMTTWDSQTCSTIGIVGLPYNNRDLGVVERILGFGGSNDVFADITHAGWLPEAFFNSPPFFPPDGGEFILGVTFTAGMVDGSGNFTDINNDGKLDTAFREIYYNNAFQWTINNMPFLGSPIDVETVALHEAGHGMSQNHFGDIFVDGGLTFIHFAPFAVMNAAISRQAQVLEGTDEAGHCSIWGDWPLN